MELNNIKILIDRYFDGLTSKEEEAQIAEYFATHTTIDKELEVVRDMFLGFSNMRAIETPKTRADIIKPKTDRPRITIRHFAGVAAAAVIALAVGIGIWSNQQADIDTTPTFICYIDGVEISDEELARSETSRLLGNVANNMTLAMASIEKYTPLTKR